MVTFINPFFRSLFIGTLGLFVVAACGVDENSSVSRSNGTGSYAAGLFFPADIPRMDTVANALGGINCDANGISVIRFAFFDATDTPLEAVLKILLGFKVEAGPSVQPQEYSKYFED